MTNPSEEVIQRAERWGRKKEHFREKGGYLKITWTGGDQGVSTVAG